MDSNAVRRRPRAGRTCWDRTVHAGAIANTTKMASLGTTGEAVIETKEALVCECTSGIVVPCVEVAVCISQALVGAYVSRSSQADASSLSRLTAWDDGHTGHLSTMAHGRRRRAIPDVGTT